MNGFKREDLNKRICDCEEGATNTQTWRDFIVCGYKDIFEVDIEDDVDGMSEDMLKAIIDDLDYLCDK